MAHDDAEDRIDNGIPKPMPSTVDKMFKLAKELKSELYRAEENVRIAKLEVTKAERHREKLRHHIKDAAKALNNALET